MNIKPLTEDLRPFFFQDGKPIEPYIIGVTGHRHIFSKAIPKISLAFYKNLLEHFAPLIEKRSTKPILFLSGMATGIDQYAVRWLDSLRTKTPNFDVFKIVAVLPMPEEDYYEDFKTPQQQADFEQAMNVADAKIVLPLTPENQRLRNQGEKIHRTEQYEQLADFISSSCRILYAFWDGQNLNKPKPGSTTDVMFKKRDFTIVPSCSLAQRFPYQEYVKSVINYKVLGDIIAIFTPKDNIVPDDMEILCKIGEKKVINIGEDLQKRYKRNMNKNNVTPLHKLWYKKGLHFQCTGCGGCCTGQPGFIWITPQEKEAIAQFLNLSVEEFEQKYVRLVYGVRESLKELPEHNYDCIFFDSESRKCTIYDVRPTQCRTWPFWDSLLEYKEAWQEAAKHCKGCNQGPLIPVEEIELKRKKISV